MLVENTGSTPNKSHPTLLAAPAIGFRSPNVRVVLWGIWQIIPCCPAATNDTFMIFQWYFTQTHLGVSQKHTHTHKKKKEINPVCFDLHRRLLSLFHMKQSSYLPPFVVGFPAWSPPPSMCLQVRDRRAFRSVSSEECPDPQKKCWDNPIASMGLVYLHTWIFTSFAEWMIRGAEATILKIQTAPLGKI